MASRSGLCPCLSQTDDVVLCELPVGHDGLHRWTNPVHPGHSKLWGGAVTEVVTSTRYRFESPKRTAERFGVFADGQGNATYAPMQSTTQDEDLDGQATEFLQGRGAV
jgi:hypothetical protein